MQKKNKKLALELGMQTYQIFRNDDEVCIPSISNILLAVLPRGWLLLLVYLPCTQI